MMLKNILRYSHFALIVLRPGSRQRVDPVNDIFKRSVAHIKTLSLCAVNGKDPVIAFFDQKNGVCLNTADIDGGEHLQRQRNQVSVVDHNGNICLMKTYKTVGCLINEVRSLDRLKHIVGVPKLIDISLKHQQVHQSLVPGTALSTILNDNGKTPVELYLYENEMTYHPEYPLDFDPLSAAALLSPTFIKKLGLMINAVHDAGVLIRDVKFGNIMVEDDTPHLVDFDAATVISSRSKVGRLTIAAENNYFNRLLPLNLPSL
jgi:serine/threonine protein kinase